MSSPAPRSVAGGDRGLGEDRAVADLDVLLGDHRGGAVGDRAAGRDPDRAAVGERRRRRRPGARLADDGQGPAGLAVRRPRNRPSPSTRTAARPRRPSGRRRAPDRGRRRSRPARFRAAGRRSSTRSRASAIVIRAARIASFLRTTAVACRNANGPGQCVVKVPGWSGVCHARRRPGPVVTEGVEALLLRGEELAKGWLLALVEDAPLESAAAIMAGDVARDGPRICDAVVRAIYDEADLRRIEPGGVLEPLVSRAGELAGVRSAETAAHAVETLRSVIWSALRIELARTDPDLLADAGERLSLVAELVRAAVLRRRAEGEAGGARDACPPLRVARTDATAHAGNEAQGRPVGRRAAAGRSRTARRKPRRLARRRRRDAAADARRCALDRRAPRRDRPGRACPAPAVAAARRARRGRAAARGRAGRRERDVRPVRPGGADRAPPPRRARVRDREPGVDHRARHRPAGAQALGSGS